MARTADKPGSWRILGKGEDNLTLSGVNSEGKRVKVPGLTRQQANEYAKSLFRSTPTATTVPEPLIQTVNEQLDDWGVPFTVSAQTVQVHAPAPSPPPAPSTPIPTIPKVDGATPTPATPTLEQKLDSNTKGKRAAQAKSLMELVGVAFAAGDVWVGRRLCDAIDSDAVMPNQRQVNDLRDVTTETLTEMFGDKEVKPWQMMILLALGIPLSMLLQSPKKKPKELPKLTSVK